MAEDQTLQIFIRINKINWIFLIKLMSIFLAIKHKIQVFLFYFFCKFLLFLALLNSFGISFKAGDLCQKNTKYLQG